MPSGLQELWDDPELDKSFYLASGLAPTVEASLSQSHQDHWAHPLCNQDQDDNLKTTTMTSLPLTELLEGSEEELGAHPEPPSGANVGDNLHLKHVMTVNMTTKLSHVVRRISMFQVISVQCIDGTNKLLTAHRYIPCFWHIFRVKSPKPIDKFRKHYPLKYTYWQSKLVGPTSRPIQLS